MSKNQGVRTWKVARGHGFVAAVARGGRHRDRRRPAKVNGRVRGRRDWET
jgi:hypothetical protein